MRPGAALRMIRQRATRSIPARRRYVVSGRSAAQFVFDLAVDALELGREILHQHFQAPLAAVDDLPQLMALIVCEALVGELDPRLHDVAAPRFCAGADEFGWLFWHALDLPGVPHLGDTMPWNGTSFRLLCGMVNGLVPAVRRLMVKP